MHVVGALAHAEPARCLLAHALGNAIAQALRHLPAAAHLAERQHERAKPDKQAVERGDLLLWLAERLDAAEARTGHVELIADRFHLAAKALEFRLPAGPLHLALDELPLEDKRGKARARPRQAEARGFRQSGRLGPADEVAAQARHVDLGSLGQNGYAIVDPRPAHGVLDAGDQLRLFRRVGSDAREADEAAAALDLDADRIAAEDLG